jgi:hypothetical protein
VTACPAETGTVTVSAGVGYLSTLYLMTQRLLETIPAYPQAPWTLTSIALQAGLAQYGAAAYSSKFTLPRHALKRLGLPGNTSATSSTVPACVALAAALSYTVDAVHKLTLDDYKGLVYDAENSYPGWTRPRTTDAFLNLAVRPS